MEKYEIECPRTMYKINQPFHQNGNNNIDFSTTRFHNIVVVRHEDELKDFISAQEKAQKEEKVSELRKKSTEHSQKVFVKKTEENCVKIMKKAQAEDNMKKLNEEVKRLAELRKRNTNKETNIIETKPYYSQGLNQRSEQMLSRLIDDKVIC